MKRLFLALIILLASVSIVSAAGGMASKAAQIAAITSGTIDGTTIGGTTPKAGTFTSVDWAKPANIADSATPAIGAAAGNVVDLDGTTTITGFDTVTAGITRFVTFTGVRVLTYNATSLILPGVRNITTTAGDRATFISLGSGNWRCHEYLKASGIATGMMDETTIITSATLSNAQSFGGQINNYAQTADCIVTLPAIAKGMNFLFIASTTVAKYYRFDPNASDGIILDGAAIDTDGHYVQVASVAQGNAIQFVALQTGAAAWDWFVTTISGSWISE